MTICVKCVYCMSKPTTPSDQQICDAEPSREIDPVTGKPRVTYCCDRNKGNCRLFVGLDYENV